MSPRKSGTKPRLRSSRRPPRADTRKQLLAAAGEVFADKGIHAATGQEICQRAAVNSAAINYYFGGMEGLYEAILLEAIDLCANPDVVPVPLTQSNDPREMLREIMAPLISTITSALPGSWVSRLLVREFICPSSAGERLFLDAQALPQARLLKAIVAQIVGLPVDHPAVAQGCIAVLAPLQIMIIGQPTLFDRMYPEIDVRSASNETLEKRALAFALGGLEALTKAEEKLTPHATEGEIAL